MFDLLPLVLSGPDGIPQIFELPDEIVMRVKIRHPTIPELEKLKLGGLHLHLLVFPFVLQFLY